MKSQRIMVIGAGLGSVATAAKLARQGHEVHVYEQNAHVGGKLNVREMEGFSFDLGPSILTLPDIFEQVFHSSGKTLKDYVKLVRLRPHWRNFFEDGTVVDLDPNLSHTCVNKIPISKQDKKDIEQYLQHSKRIYDFTKEGYFDKGLDTFTEIMHFYGLRRLLREAHIFSTFHRNVNAHIKNPYLCSVFDFLIKYVGSSAYRAPAILGLMAHVQFEGDLWFVRGGMGELSKACEHLLHDLGVHVHFKKKVVSLKHQDERVVSACLQSGEEVKADLFVSNMEVIPAHEQLLKASKKTLKRYKAFEPSCSGLVLHLGVSKTYPQLAHHNFFFSDNPKKHFHDVFVKKVLPEDPTIYLVAPTRTEKSLAPEGCENIKILPHIPHLTDNPPTPFEYERLRIRVLEKLERMGLKDLRKHTVVEDMWTPREIQTMYSSTRGSIYGVVSDRWKNLGLKAPKKSSRYRNLYFVGGSVNPGGGMPMALLSGLNAANMIEVEKFRG